MMSLRAIAAALGGEVSGGQVLAPAAGNHVDIIRAWGFKPSTFGFTWIKTLASATSVTVEGEGLFTGNGYATRGWTVWGNEISRSDFHVPLAEQRGSA
jgi:hypothetical protein